MKTLSTVLRVTVRFGPTDLSTVIPIKSELGFRMEKARMFSGVDTDSSVVRATAHCPGSNPGKLQRLT